MIEVRLAESRDFPAVASLVQEVHALHALALPDVFQPPTTTVATAADLERLASRPGHLLLVAVRAGVAVGYAHAEVQEEPESAYKRGSTVLHVHAMGVTEAKRGRGVGRALLDAVRGAAAARGIERVSLEVYAFNTAARAFYARQGFVTLRERLVVPTGRPTSAGERAS
jgi:diamine N-acetyltransferase